MLSLTKVIFYAFWIRALTAVLRPFLPFDMPHVWRQVDTIAISIRYWMRWTVENELRHPLVPAVLNSMDGYGLMPMEFPVVNLLGAPFFALGPGLGQSAAVAFLIAIHFAFTWVCYLQWRTKKVFGFEIGNTFLLIPVLGISGVFVTKFMPDTLAMLILLSGVGLLWDRKSIWGMLLVSLGLLIKPSSVIVLILIVMQDVSWKERIKNVAWTIPAFICAGLYFTVGLSWIASMQDTPLQFGVHARNPFASFIEFFMHPLDLAKLLITDLIFVGAPILVALALPLLSKVTRRQIGFLTGALILQLLGMAALDGSHSFIHSYYHIGTSPLVAIMVVMCIGALLAADTSAKVQKLRRWLLALMYLGIAATLFNTLFFELRSLAPSRAGRFIWPNEVSELKKRNPDFPWNQGYSFRVSNLIPYPYLGVAFGEREGSAKAKYGFFLNTETPPAECRVVDKSQSVSLVVCDTPAEGSFK